MSPAHLSKLLLQASAPLCIFDEQRQLVFANQALEELFAISFDDMLGHVASYGGPVTGKPTVDAVSMLCPPPQAFVDQFMSVPIAVPAKPPNDQLPHEGGLAPSTGEANYRARCLPLSALASPSMAGGVLVVLTAPSSDDAEVSVRSDLGKAEWPGLHAALQRSQQVTARQAKTSPLFGVSAARERVAHQVEMLAATPSAATIIGPLGAPRSALAEYLHASTQSHQRGRFLALDCGQIPWDELQESVFSFLAAGEPTGESTIDTILLDSLDEIPELEQHVAGEFISRLGREVRLLAATKSSLQTLAQQGTFDERLAAMLGTAELVIPPLTARREDIPLTAQAHVEFLNAASQCQRAGFSKSAMDDLCLGSWPGDVAELNAVVAMAHQHAAAEEISRDDLPEAFSRALQASSESVVQPLAPIDLEAYLAEIEATLIRRALDHAKGNKTKAAELLGMTRPRLYRRLGQLGWSDEA
ncbi:MAG: sigma 54-interacting transcriptional regulator [Pirellulales bacterium]|nr:sigma 54-interacting transcriptional regulator [Pirellulales bacterium]